MSKKKEGQQQNEKNNLIVSALHSYRIGGTRTSRPLHNCAEHRLFHWSCAAGGSGLFCAGMAIFIPDSLVAVTNIVFMFFHFAGIAALAGRHRQLSSCGQNHEIHSQSQRKANTKELRGRASTEFYSRSQQTDRSTEEPAHPVVRSHRFISYAKYARKNNNHNIRLVLEYLCVRGTQLLCTRSRRRRDLEFLFGRIRGIADIYSTVAWPDMAGPPVDSLHIYVDRWHCLLVDVLGSTGSKCHVGFVLRGKNGNFIRFRCIAIGCIGTVSNSCKRTWDERELGDRDDRPDCHSYHQSHGECK